MTLAHAAVVKNIKNVAVNKVNEVNKVKKVNRANKVNKEQDDRRKKTETSVTFREILFFKGLSLTSIIRK